MSVNTVYQHYLTSFVDTLLSTTLHPSFNQTLEISFEIAIHLFWVTRLVQNSPELAIFRP